MTRFLGETAAYQLIKGRCPYFLSGIAAGCSAPKGDRLCSKIEKLGAVEIPQEVTNEPGDVPTVNFIEKIHALVDQCAKDLA